MKRQIKHSNLSRLTMLAFAMIALTESTRTLIAQQDNQPESLEIRNLWLDEITCATIPPTFVVNDAYISLWMESIQHSEVDLRQELVATFEKIHTQGVDQTSIAEKIRGLLSSDNHHTFNMALASLLVALDDQQSADQLFALLKPGRIELSQIIEPALANWKFEPIKSIWKDRLKEKKIRRTHLTLAIRGLGDIQDASSVELLQGFVMDRSQPATIRVAAAKAVGNICENGLTSDAKQLADRIGSRGIVDRLCAVAMLARHRTDSSNQLLQHLLLDEEGAVAGAAWQQLLAIDSSLAVPSTIACHRNPDPLVRLHVVTSLFEQPNIERISLLGKMLADHHPDVRILARSSLLKLASQSENFDVHTRSVGMEIIDDQGAGFRELEQALVLLASLDHKPVASRASDLLGHQHPKVMVATAWALRRLQVEETFPAMLNRANKISKILMAKQMNHFLYSSEHMDQVAHLFDSFGVSEYKPAESLMRTFIPKNLDLFNNCRPAAIAAIGKLNSGNPEPALVRLLIQRMNDQILDPSESEELCATCAIALARMGAKSAVDDIQQYYEGTPPISGLNYAAAWSIRELTGKNFPDPASPIMKRTGFILEPGFARIQDVGGDPDIGSGLDDQ